MRCVYLPLYGSVKPDVVEHAGAQLRGDMANIVSRLREKVIESAQFLCVDRQR